MMEQRFFAVVLGVVTASVAMLTVGCGSGAHGTTAYTTNAIQSDAAAQPSSAGNADSGAGGSNPGTGSSSFGGTASGDDAGADASLGFGTGSGDDASADAGAPCSNPDNLEGCTCSPGQTQKCYAGNPAQAGVGVCTWGTQSCVQSGEFSQWGPCTGSGAPTPAACDGIDHLCNGMPNVGCACTTGATQNCYDGPPGTEGVGTCVGGSQTCVAGASGGSSWGPCNGEVLPTAEVCTDNLDHSCSGLAGCQNPMCSATAGCIAQQTTYCNEGGMVYVNDVSYTGTCEYGSATLCSGDSSGNGAACGPTLGQGGTFNTRCAGTYQVCGRVVSNAGCTIAKGCVSVTVPTDNATVPLPAFPGFGPLTNACLDATCSSGSMSTSLDVTGMTTTGIAVNRPNVATNIDTEYWGGGGGGSGSGGGGF